MYKQTMRSSAFKQTATAGGSDEGQDIKTNVDAKVSKKKKPYVGASNDACSKEYIAKNGRAKCDEYEALPQKKKDDGNNTTTTECPEGSTKDANGKCVKTTKGKSTSYEGNLQTAKYGKVLEPWEINRLKSGTRKATNERSKAAYKLDRNDGVEFKDGKYVLKGTASAKERRKFNKYNDRYSQADSTVKNQGLARESGGTAGDSYYKGDRDRGLGEQADSEQKSQFKREAVKTEAAKEKAKIEAVKKTAQEETEQQTAEVENVTTGQAGGAVGTDGGQAVNAIKVGGTGGPGGMFDIDLAPTDYSKLLQGGNAVAKKRGYTQKAKSVATRKLQGAQGKLPSHLQASIKAAPGKRVLKKGYFKNK